MKVVIADTLYDVIYSMEEMLCLYSQVEIVVVYKNRTNKPEALQILKTNLSVFELKIPGLNGFEVLSEIRKANKALKSIILTFFSTNDYRPQAMVAGSVYFFSKVDDFEKVSQEVPQMIQEENNIT